MSDLVIIQYRTEGGQWSNVYSGVLNQGGRVLDAMKQCKDFVGQDKQVRAVDRDGRIVDFLG